eukprot:CAMPEP_0197649748 /NCGR_PEP_ID=MMETSP1338-20131121/29593_1 /TAXON_ID=43686 ORGANISM="Pelagodinium beii, Strain RCC1491" /NCGR_SAMPLE_ID=MMETSP1338 /ASSEMBLY_ACC=CAM_ASM_000754 /LENGTH=61 /DNA_ID=CAMNT_0043224011 /DNA_START=23 /DNA_END=205 /DNA_ORIENTATION=+
MTFLAESAGAAAATSAAAGAAESATGGAATSTAADDTGFMIASMDAQTRSGATLASTRVTM